MWMLRCYGKNGYEVTGNQEILEKAIQKAIDGGWNNIEGFKPINLGGKDVGLEYAGSVAIVQPSAMIFDQSFSKALWGDTGEGAVIPDETFIDNTGTIFRIKRPLWKTHLSRMVVSSDPIKYLGEHLDD